MLRNERNILYRFRQHVPILPASHLYDAVMQYAVAVREIYLTLNGTRGAEEAPPNVKEIGRNGTAIAERLKDLIYPSILGFNVTMGADRASKGSYSAYYFHRSVKCADSKYISLLNCTSHCLIELYSSTDNELPNVIPFSIKVLDMPICGYDGKECNAGSTDVRLIILTILGVLIFSLFLTSLLQYRHWKYEQEISGLSWRINKTELKIPKNYITQSRTSITSVDCIFQVMNFNLIAEYRGTTCCLKHINLESKKPDLNRKVMKSMKSMREIKHRNVCPFIGAYIHDRQLTLITEYANRGSLEDILPMTNINLDEHFIASLVQDLLRAMVYLHNSLIPHGNLKSNNCVVTGRWVLQVTDYDLPDIRYEARKSQIKELSPEMQEWKKYYRSLLWRAPELLKNELSPGTKEGDVYSFGIILHEIIARQGPFSTDCVDEIDYKAVIDELKSGSTASGSLRRPDILDMVMNPFGTDPDVKAAMEASWAEDPKTRPYFRDLSTRLKKMKSSRGNLVDHMVNLLEDHNKNLEDLVSSKTSELGEEKKRSEELLHSMLPEEVARSICSNIHVPPKSFDSVTIYFSDIVGFTALASDSTPIQIFQFLDDLYQEFDNTIRGFDVYKVETIGDAYMVVSGLPDSKKKVPHAGAIASMALEILEKTKSFKIRHKPDHCLKLRIGLHTGPVIAGVVGKTMPRYCLFGDTVNMASRMESNGAPLRIHISKECQVALVKMGGYDMETREKICVKGKGEVQTYWLNAAGEGAIKRKEPGSPIMEMLPPDGGCELRRRSPRLSVEMRTPRPGPPRRTSSVIRSVYEEDDMCLSSRNNSPPRMLSKPHFRRLSNSLKASSMESPSRLLSLPKETNSSRSRTPSTGSVRESHSLDRLPACATLTTEVSSFKNQSSSPCSSEPNLIPFSEMPPRVNFSPSAYSKYDEINEADPMLENRPSDFYIEGEESPGASQRASIKSFLQSILPKGKREILNSEKSSLNGLQRESHV